VKVKLIVSLILVALVAGAGALFWVQNASRTTILSIGFGFTGLQLSEPIPIPLLMLICLGVGGLTTIPLIIRLFQVGGRVKRLERQVALSEQSSDWP